VKTYRQISPV